MQSAANRKALVAIDLGAQSCRVSLLRWRATQPEIEFIHRFANEPQSVDGDLRWDIDAIFAGVKAGLELCAARAHEGIASIGVDGWAVDYVRLNASGHPVAQPFCYRDTRTERAEHDVHSVLSPARLYSLTGIQILRINTLYQLHADKIAGADTRLPWLNLPEYIMFRLCGRRIGEYTNATHTGLMALGTRSWCQEIFQQLGLDLTAAPAIVPCGSVLGPISGDLARLPAFRETKIVAPACHDTASAIAAIPAVGDDWAFISSGTWSLVGTVLDSPCVTRDAQSMNFTNLGGAGGKICFLKNVNGMWLLRQCLDEWEHQGIHVSLPQLIADCASLPAPPALIDIDDPQLILPGNTIEKINAQLQRAAQPPITSSRASVPAISNLIFHSMAARYAEVLASIASITGKKLKRLFIVGGGSQNALLNELTARHTSLTIMIGAVESATIGNFAIQMAALESGRDQPGVAEKGVTPESVAFWAEQLSRAPVVQKHIDAGALGTAGRSPG